VAPAGPAALGLATVGAPGPPSDAGGARITAFAPGRVNLIGEHTDYNGGLALPFAIDRGVTVTAERVDGDTVRAVAADLDEADEFPLAAPPPAAGWRAFVRGAVAELRAVGHDVPAARLMIAGDIPRGAGLSSSAALCVALCLALAGRRVEGLAELASRIENDWVGAHTGLLDQLASLHGAPGAALRIDFATGARERVPLELGAWSLAVLDSGAGHEHATGGYNERREECRQAAAALGVEHLAHADPAAAAPLPEPLGRRARHVLEECARVEAAVAALRAPRLDRLGPLLDASHASLRDLYDASTPEVEAAVARMRAAGAVGARMMGGGFGGAVLGLFPPGATPPGGALAVAPAAGARLWGGAQR
jgi:galactokinase